MGTTCTDLEVSKAARITGRVLSGLIVAFMIFDGAIKVVPIQAVIEAGEKFGISRQEMFGIGVAALGCALLYAIPRTAVLGAILLTAFFGGALVTQIRAGEPMFNRVFPVAFGVVTWLGLYLRDPRVRTLAPIRSLPCGSRAEESRVALAA